MLTHGLKITQESLGRKTKMKMKMTIKLTQALNRLESKNEKQIVVDDKDLANPNYEPCEWIWMRISRDILVHVLCCDNMYYLCRYNPSASAESSENSFSSKLNYPYVFDIVDTLSMKEFADFHEQRLRFTHNNDTVFSALPTTKMDDYGKIEFHAPEKFVSYVLNILGKSLS